MLVIFVHGWSVTHTDTYGGLPQALANAAANYNILLDIQHIYLGRYISFHDEVSLDDISRAMDRALRDLPGNNKNTIQEFSCITHSTGGPVVRNWIERYYGSAKLKDLPLKHLVMLAPANHGSTLAVLGKARVGRIKAWWSGVEPGQRVLDWLCLGSDGQWTLNERYLGYDYVNNGFYPFVLTGQGIDNKLYDFLNNYLVEKGSDGVVRVATANMNYRYFRLVQNTKKILSEKPLTYALEADDNVRTSPPVPLGVYKNYSHSGKNMGIMGSIKANNTQAPVVADILKCLRVNSSVDYQTRGNELNEQTKAQQTGDARYCMLVFNIRDDEGNRIKKDDYDLYLLAGNNYKPDQLPVGFFKDRQMNEKTGRLAYYLDAEKMGEIKDHKFGLRVVARPTGGFSYYCAAEFRSDGILAETVLTPNQTTYVEVVLHRFVDQEVFRFEKATDKQASFKKVKPSGKPLNHED